MVHICVRATLDWGDEAVVDANIHAYFRPKVSAWNATFTVPYHAFRHRLKVIAGMSLDRVEGARQSHLADVPRGDLIVPVDDDDWLAPGLAAHLTAAHDPGSVGYLWRREVLEARKPVRRAVRQIARLLGVRGRFTCKTNNYAIVNEPGLVGLASSHVQASRYFDAHVSRVTSIPARLAIQNRNLGSQTALAWRRPSIGRDELVNLLARHRGLYAAWRAAPDLRWAQRYVDLMSELMQDIRVR